MKVDSPFDLELMVGLVESIASLQEDLGRSKMALDVFKAEIARHVTTNDKYFVGGKPPSMSYISSDYHVLGYDDESQKTLFELAQAVISLDAELSRAKMRFGIEKDKLDVWRTASANIRNTVSFVGDD